MNLKWIILFLTVLLLGNAALAATPYKPDSNAAALAQDLSNSSNFSSMAGVIVPDPIVWLKKTSEGVTKLHITGRIEIVAGLILFAGLIVSLYQGWYAGDIKLILGAFLRAILCGLCIMFSFNQGASSTGSNNAKVFSFSEVMFTTWGAAYGWTVVKFGPTVDSVVEQSTEAMIGMLGEAVLVAGSVAVGGAAGKVATQGISRLILAVRSGAGLADVAAMDGAGILKTYFGNAAPAALGGMRNGITALLGRLGMVYGAMLPILAAYSAVVYISGLLVLLGIYMLPIAFALIGWGQRDSIWMIFGTFLSSFFSVIFLPLMLVVGLQIAFLQPAAMVRTYTQQMAAARAASEKAAQVASDAVNAQHRSLVDQCNAAMTADPQNGMNDPSCQQTTSAAANSNPLDLVGNALSSLWGTIKDTFDGIWAGIMRIILAFVGVSVGMVIATRLMFQLPGMVAKFLKGTSERYIPR